MADGTPYVSDISSVVVNGLVTNLDPTGLATTLGAGNYVTPSADFSLSYNGVTVSGRAGVPIPTDTQLKAYLLANAPVD